MDLDPNYDPSDFLQMTTKKDTSIKIDYTNIKQEPPSQSQIYEQDSSFNMSELLYEKRTTKIEHGLQSESSELTVQSQVIDFASQENSSLETYSQEMILPQQNIPQNENIDDVAIHDDLAISDSDEEQQQGDSMNQSENANDNDADLWF